MGTTTGLDLTAPNWYHGLMGASVCACARACACACARAGARACGGVRGRAGAWWRVVARGGAWWRVVARGGAWWRVVACGCVWLRVSACACACGCVCVCTIWIDVKLLICRGSPGSRGGRWPTKTPPRGPCKRTCRTPVVHLGAIISRSWWPPESYILYIYIIFISPVRFYCVVFARPMHSTSVIR